MSSCKICVVGAGVIGLSSAVNIQQRIPQSEVTIIADAFSPNTCSDGSGGFWEPYLLPKESLAQSSKWCTETWKYLMTLVKSADAGSLGAHLVSGYNYSGVHLPNDPSWKDQVLGYRHITEEERQLHPDKKDGVWYTTIMIDVKKYLPWLMCRFKEKNGKIVFKSVQSLNELVDDFDIVVNCSGIGAHKLGDKSVFPVRGQVMRVKAPWVKHFYFDNDLTEKGNKLYIFPGKDFVVLGGTSQKNDWNTQCYETDSNRIKKGCSRLIPSLESAEILEEWTGLRPSRPTIRLEAEEIMVNGREKQIIHNYGHAGSGITLHWGCAIDVADLCKSWIRKRRYGSYHSKL